MCALMCVHVCNVCVCTHLCVGDHSIVKFAFLIHKFLKIDTMITMYQFSYIRIVTY